MRRKVTPETALKRAIKGALAAFGWFSFPILQGLGAHRGVSDMIAVKGGRVLFIEVKTPTGRLSDNQKRFRDDIQSKGGEYVVIDDIDRLLAWLRGGEQGEI
jgi:hypothetical protein